MMLRRLLYTFLVLSAVSNTSPLLAAGAETWLRLGDSAYMQNVYDSAVYFYSRAADADKSSAVARYKLGNAYYRQRETGAAVLAYQQSLKLNPGLSAAAENTSGIQRSIYPASATNEVFFVRWWNGLVRPAVSNLWAISGVLLFCFPLLLITWRRYSGKPVLWLRPQLVAWVIILAVCCSVVAVLSATSGMYTRKAVVMKNDAPLQITQSGKKSVTSGTATLPEGLLVVVKSVEKNAVLVNLPDGREGLIQRSDIALVE